MSTRPSKEYASVVDTGTVVIGSRGLGWPQLQKQKVLPQHPSGLHSGGYRQVLCLLEPLNRQNCTGRIRAPFETRASDSLVNGASFSKSTWEVKMPLNIKSTRKSKEKLMKLPCIIESKVDTGPSEQGTHALI